MVEGMVEFGWRILSDAAIRRHAALSSTVVSHVQYESSILPIIHCIASIHTIAIRYCDPTHMMRLILQLNPAALDRDSPPIKTCSE